MITMQKEYLENKRKEALVKIGESAIELVKQLEIDDESSPLSVHGNLLCEYAEYTTVCSAIDELDLVDIEIKGLKDE